MLVEHVYYVMPSSARGDIAEASYIYYLWEIPYVL